MHKPSEMAIFMNALYAFNLQTKNQIIAGESPAQIPLDLLKLHSAEMTKGKERTKVWNSFVNVFIESQQAVADTLSGASLKSRYNTAINNCLACHETECVGPIPKIKKLLIRIKHNDPPIIASLYFLYNPVNAFASVLSVLNAINKLVILIATQEALP